MGALSFTLSALTLSACNQIYGIEETSVPPGPSCPDGMPPPITNRLLQVTGGDCREFSFSETTARAIALCVPSLATEELREGRVDGELSPAKLSGVPAGLVLDFPRISSDGRELWVTTYIGSSQTTVAVLDRDGNGWKWRGSIAAVKESVDTLVVGVVDGPSGRRLLAHVDPGRSEPVLVERADDGTGTWTIETGRWPPATFGLDYFDRVGVSADGRRIVLGGETMAETKQYYAERPDIDEPFSPLQEFPNLPVGVDSSYLLTADCGRVYFSALGRVFYATQ